MSETRLESRVTALEAQVAVLKAVVEKLEKRLAEASSRQPRRRKPVNDSLVDRVSRSTPDAPIEKNPKPPRGPMID